MGILADYLSEVLQVSGVLSRLQPKEKKFHRDTPVAANLLLLTFLVHEAGLLSVHRRGEVW